MKRPVLPILGIAIVGLAFAGATPLPAQEVAPGVQVERVTLRPGESASFTLAPGISHQLLRRAEPSAADAITVRYEVADGQSRIIASGRTGRPLVFSVLADPDGNGGFSAMGDMTLPGDGTAAARSWPGALGAVNLGDFRPGPTGGRD